jgi:signal transduction histidine kinase
VCESPLHRRQGGVAAKRPPVGTSSAPGRNLGVPLRAEAAILPAGDSETALRSYARGEVTLSASLARSAVPPARGAPRLRDVAIAAAALAGELALLDHGGFGAVSGGRHALDFRGGLLAAVSTLPLVVWRWSPLGVLALTTLASATLNLLHYPPGPPFGPTAALFLLAASGAGEPGRWKRPTVAVVGALLVAHVASAGVGERSVPFLPFGFAILLWAVAWFAGDRVRLRSERIAALEERALRAEQAAERERRMAAAEERMRIARDLHDSAGHAINVILVQAGAARLLQDRDPARSRAALETIEDVARQTVCEIDRLVHRLRDEDAAAGAVEAPPGLASLPSLVEQHRLAGQEVTVRREGEPRPLPATVDQAAYRILQEALTNAARHGGGPVEVTLCYSADRLGISVRNPEGGGPPGDGGHGLVGMRERAGLLGGSVTAAAENGEFAVRAELPLAVGGGR